LEFSERSVNKIEINMKKGEGKVETETRRSKDKRKTE
jgi:hypothetical protein